IGREAALAFAGRGCRVALGARRVKLLQDLTQEISRRHPGLESLAISLDLADPASIEAAVARVLRELGRIDILVNNAGVAEFDWVEHLDPKTGIAEPIAVNLTGAILLTRAVLPGMIASRRGQIIFVGSLAGLVSTPTYGVYAATKAGLLAFADSLRREVGIWGLRVSTLLPGAVDTGFAAESVAQRKTRLRTPKRLRLSPERAGEAVAQLAERPRRIWILPAWMRPVLWLGRACPWLVDRVVEIGFVRRERLPPEG
ncbi:MAG TPA: SDR family NAD(P)-dependent oxidoreductase, partial [Anaerolineales bacterium]|nr:SDR family NAD(P)-dependent oxidoreductase [Anaerolineales bacterium]